jgi:hypothetical protein
MIFFIPFQHIFVNFIKPLSPAISVFFNRLDKITILIFLPIALIKLYKNNNAPNKRFYVFLFIPILFIGLGGLISGIVNGNPFLATFHGTFHYFMYPLLMFIYAAFFSELSIFKRVFRILLIIAVSLGVIALVQAVWAYTNLYILKKGVFKIYYLELGTLLGGVGESDFGEPWRIGLYRTSSLMINYNFLGLYVLLIFVIYMYFVEKRNSGALFFLIFSIFGSVSRIVYTGFIFISGIQLLRGRKWFLLLLIPFIVLIVRLSFLYDYPLIKTQDYFEAKEEAARLMKREKSNDRVNMSFREYAKMKGIEIWRDQPVFGVGPGMYGGAISLKYNSPVYEKYNFSPYMKYYLDLWRTIDQFWPQILAELGIIGVIGHGIFFISLATVFVFLIKKSLSNQMKGLFTAFLLYTVVVLIYTVGLPLNIAPISYTYFALIGMGLGCVVQDIDELVGRESIGQKLALKR